MSTFKFKKAMENIEEPELLDKAWYEVELVEDPKLLPNNEAKKLLGDSPEFEEVERANADDPKYGMNAVLTLRVISDLPEESGRRLKLYIPYPMEADEKRYDGRGMIVYDAKQERFSKLSQAIHGESSGDEVEIGQGQRFQVFVDQQINPQTKTPGNTIDLFAGFKPGSRGDAAEISDGNLDHLLKKGKKK